MNEVVTINFWRHQIKGLLILGDILGTINFW